MYEKSMHCDFLEYTNSILFNKTIHNKIKQEETFKINNRCYTKYCINNKCNNYNSNEIWC